MSATINSATATVAGEQLYYNPPAASASALAPGQATLVGADPYSAQLGLDLKGGLNETARQQQMQAAYQTFQAQQQPMMMQTAGDADVLQQHFNSLDTRRQQNIQPGDAEGLGGDEVPGAAVTPVGATTPSAETPLDLRRQLCDQNLFIFHLPSEWREHEIREAFGPFGNIISAKVVKRPDGSSKGYGFVCYESRESAVMAVEQMNGYSVAGKRLKVSLKKTPEECLNMQVQKLLRMSQQNEYYDRDRDCSLFVFHLPPHWDDENLREEFEPFGPVVAAKVSRKEDGTSRGYGFVTCPDPRSAALAILHLNGLEVCNKRLKVQPKQLSGATHPRPDCTVFVFHLPNDWTDSVLKQFFSHCGRVVSATVQRDPRGRSRGFGFVTFDRQQAARDAVAELNGVSVGVKRLKVSLKRSTGNAQGSDPTLQVDPNTGSPVGSYSSPHSPQRYDVYRGGTGSPNLGQNASAWDGSKPRSQQAAWLTQGRGTATAAGIAGNPHQAAIVRDSAYAGAGFSGVAAAMAARSVASSQDIYGSHQATAGVSPGYAAKLVDNSGQQGYGAINAKAHLNVFTDAYASASGTNPTAAATTRREDYLLQQQQQQFYSQHMMVSPLLAQQQNRSMMMLPTSSTPLVAASNPYAAAQQASYQMAAARGSAGTAGSAGLQQWGAAAATVPYTATHPNLAAQQRGGLYGASALVNGPTMQQLGDVDRS